MDKELENIFKQIATDLHNKPWKNRLISLTGWKGGENKEDVAVKINETDKYAEFSEKYRQKARSIKELGHLLEYLNKNDYKSNLD
jgi:hypothetical protein